MHCLATRPLGGPRNTPDSPAIARRFQLDITIYILQLQVAKFGVYNITYDVQLYHLRPLRHLYYDYKIVYSSS